VAEVNLKILTRKVDLLTLRLFLTLEEERHLGRSAVRENIAPSAVTKRIQDFEDMVGAELFHRGPKGVVPTPVGRVVAQHVRSIFGSLDNMRREIDDFVGGVRGHIRICTTESIITEFLANEIGDFVLSFPDVQVDLVEERNRDVIQAGANGAADVVIYALTADLDDSAVDSVPYRTDNLVAVLPRGHALRGRSSIAFRELLDSDFIGLSPNTSLMMQLRHAAEEAGCELKVKYQVASNEAARSLVRAGLGVTVQPDGLVTFSDQGRICAVQLTEPWAVRHLRAGTPKRRLPVAAARAFLRQLTNPTPHDVGRPAPSQRAVELVGDRLR
jgi:DNA-binding transcriptional LysR family regulator